MDGFYREIISFIMEEHPSKDRLSARKNILARKHQIVEVPTDIDILLHALPTEYPKIKDALITKPSRTGSGVAVIAVMTSPHKCPHGRCVYCPGGPGSSFGDVPQSYTGREPATMRGIRNGYDPYLQVFNRLEQYVALGQSPEKAELIIMGGTFPAMDRRYRERFVSYSLKAMNDFSSAFYSGGTIDMEKYMGFFELPGKVSDRSRAERIRKKTLRMKGKASLPREKARNERAMIRCVGMTIETRPDYGMIRQAEEALEMGCTRVELGVQNIDDRMLMEAGRGHTVSDIIESTRTLKDLGFKVNYHLMPGLPGSTPASDLKMMRKVLEDPDFRPDMLKIYPCMVMKGTRLHRMWKRGSYRPYGTDEAAALIAEFKAHVPEWVRIMRVQRDIPTSATEAGVDRTNLRQYIGKIMKEKGIACRCIRCREPRNSLRISKSAKTLIRDYSASGGTEYFISAEDPRGKVLLGFCRLRLPSSGLRKEITKGTAIVRELHVFGTAAGLGRAGDVQHKGHGRSLLKRAELIAKGNHMNKIIVISGIGAREYYRNLGYRREGPYMAKRL